MLIIRDLNAAEANELKIQLGLATTRGSRKGFVHMLIRIIDSPICSVEDNNLSIRGFLFWWKADNRLMDFINLPHSLFWSFVIQSCFLGIEYGTA